MTINYNGTRAQYMSNVGTYALTEAMYGSEDGSSWSAGGQTQWTYFDITTFQSTQYNYWVPWIEFMVPCREVICTDGSIVPGN